MIVPPPRYRTAAAPDVPGRQRRPALGDMTTTSPSVDRARPSLSRSAARCRLAAALVSLLVLASPRPARAHNDPSGEIGFYALMAFSVGAAATELTLLIVAATHEHTNASLGASEIGIAIPGLIMGVIGTAVVAGDDGLRRNNNDAIPLLGISIAVAAMSLPCLIHGSYEVARVRRSRRLPTAWFAPTTFGSGSFGLGVAGAF